MRGWQVPNLNELSGALWIALAVVLVLVIAALIRKVARMSYFGGHAQLDPKSIEGRYLHGQLKFEEYEELRRKKTHGYAH